jgi:hypothetical protein
MEGFRELHNNTVPKKHDSQNNTPLNITPLTHVSDGLYIECPPRAFKWLEYDHVIWRTFKSTYDFNF